MSRGCWAGLSSIPSRRVVNSSACSDTVQKFWYLPMRLRRKVYSSCFVRHKAANAVGSGAIPLQASATAPTSTTVPYISKAMPFTLSLAIRVSSQQLANQGKIRIGGGRARLVLGRGVDRQEEERRARVAHVVVNARGNRDEAPRPRPGLGLLA